MANLSDIDQSQLCYLAEFSEQAQYKYYKVTSIATVTLNALSALWILSGNASIIFAVLKIPQLQQPPTLLLLSLIVNDFLMGCVLQPLSITRSLKWLLADNFCLKLTLDKARQFFIYLCRCNSLLSLLCLSVDRLIAVSVPNRYRLIVSKARAVMIIGVVWSVSLILTAIVQFALDKQGQDTMKSVPFGMMGIAIVAFQVMVIVTLHRKRQIKPTELTEEEISQSRSRVKYERKAAITLIWILLAFLVSYLPVIVIFIIRAWNGRDYLRLTTQWLEFVLYMNCAVNPVIYFHRHTNIRQEVYALLRSPRLQNNPEESA
ncbi:trace amine-associated receptor 6-like [Nematostella vectensis]|nr:trace amine-associated receptor 6-like [Nematostella vectensis]